MNDGLSLARKVPVQGMHLVQSHCNLHIFHISKPAAWITYMDLVGHVIDYRKYCDKALHANKIVSLKVCLMVRNA